MQCQLKMSGNSRITCSKYNILPSSIIDSVAKKYHYLYRMLSDSVLQYETFCQGVLDFFRDMFLFILVRRRMVF